MHTLQVSFRAEGEAPSVTPSRDFHGALIRAKVYNLKVTSAPWAQ